MATTKTITVTNQTVSVPEFTERPDARVYSDAEGKCVDGINANTQAIAKVQNGLAYIVGNTNTTGGTLAVDQFVYVKGHSTIAEGLRKVTASISANGNITTSNTSACSDGGLNALNSKITKKTIPVTADSGVSLSNENCYEMNGVVCLSFKATGSFSSASKIASIPSEYAPSITIPCFGISNNDDSLRAVYIGTTGNITMYGSSSTDIRITITYIKN